MTHTVLVVEDDDDLRGMMCDALSLGGFAVIAARDGQDALDELAARSAPVSVIVVDLVMPRVNGWELVARLQSSAELQNVPVIVHASSTARVPAGVAEILQKPVAHTRLLAVVRAHCAAC